MKRWLKRKWCEWSHVHSWEGRTCETRTIWEGTNRVPEFSIGGEGGRFIMRCPICQRMWVPK